MGEFFRILGFQRTRWFILLNLLILFSLDGIICFPESSFGTTGVFYPYFLTSIKTSEFVLDVGLVTFASIDSFDLAYFLQDSLSPGEGMWGPRFPMQFAQCR